LKIKTKGLKPMGKACREERTKHILKSIGTKTERKGAVVITGKKEGQETANGPGKSGKKKGQQGGSLTQRIYRWDNVHDAQKISSTFAMKKKTER